MRGGSRGKPKPKLRDLSVVIPTHDETTGAILTAFSTDSPIAAAIIGATLVERELEILLRPRFPRNDDEMWTRLVGEDGPIGTFNRKIVTAHAMKLCNDIVKSNLDVIRNIRNAFAHTKLMITFDHELVIAELRRIKFPENKHTKLAKSFAEIHKAKTPRDRYLMLCLTIAAELIARQNRGMAAGTRNMRRRVKRMELLMSAITAARRAFPGLEFLSHTPGFPVNPQEPLGFRQIFDPKFQESKGLLWKPPAKSSEDDDNTGN